MNKLIFFLTFSISSLGFGQTDLLLTDFQTGMPVSYTIVDNDGLTPAAQVSEYTSAWITVQDPENTLDTVAGSTSFFDPAGLANRWMITPALTLGTFGNFVEWEAKSHDASFPDDYLVLVSTTDTQLASFTDTIGHIIEEYAEWTVRSVNLSTEGYDNQTIYLAFVNITYDGFKLYVDDIHVWKNDDVAVDELNKAVTVSVYPNPTKGILTIQSESSFESAVLLNTNGQVLLKTTEKSINIEAYPNGVYFLKVNTNEGIKTIKVLKD